MLYQQVEYFGMPVRAVYYNGAWHYQNTQSLELVPFLFQDHVHINVEHSAATRIERPVHTSSPR